MPLTKNEQLHTEIETLDQQILCLRHENAELRSLNKALLAVADALAEDITKRVLAGIGSKVSASLNTVMRNRGLGDDL